MAGLFPFIAALLLVAGNACADEPIRVYAAGSLRPPFTDIAHAFKAAGGGTVVFEFGPSGLLRQRISKGEQAHVFASANTEHPQSLVDQSIAEPVRVFARNRLCGLSSPGISVTTENLLDRMLEPQVKLATSTPKADPAGDYAWELFRKAEQVRPGAFAALTSKALTLTGGPGSPQPREGHSLYGELVASGKADLFLTYCTNAVVARNEFSQLRIVPVPAVLDVGADYGVAVMKNAPAGASRFVEYLLSPPGQSILRRYGFQPPGGH